MENLEKRPHNVSRIFDLEITLDVKIRAVLLPKNVDTNKKKKHAPL